MTAGSIAARVLGGLVAAPLLIGMASAPAWAASSAPPGNNGTIKVDGQPFDQGHDNEPHPGCTFRLTFFGFDAGANTAAITFDAHPPTGSTELRRDTFTFTDTRDHGGATFDGATPAYDLSQALSQFSASKQGYHVKVSVSVNGGNAKHKVFWIDSCQQPAPAPAAPASSPRPAAAQPQQAAAEQRSVAPDQPAAASQAAPSAGPVVVPAAVLGTTDLAAASAFGIPVATTTAGPAAPSMVEALTAAYVGGPPVHASGEASAPAEVLGLTASRSASTTPSAARGGVLAFTGFNAVLWSLIGVAALGAGLLMRRFGRRPVEAA